MTNEEIIEFIRLNEVSIRQIEKDLDVPTGTINTGKAYITPKHKDRIVTHLIEYHQLNQTDLSISKNMDNVANKPVKRLKYNEGRVPDFGDGIWRYRDPDNGLWKRVIEWHYAIKKDEQGNKVKDRLGNDVRTVKESWQPSDDVVHKDKIGEFYVANNGEKVYLFNK